MSNEVVTLSVQGLTAGYGGPPIIEQVSVKASRGEITAIVGPNGAGKSTLLKTVAGLIRPTAGKVFVEGKEVSAYQQRSSSGAVSPTFPRWKMYFPTSPSARISTWAAMSASPASARGSSNFSSSFLISKRRHTGVPVH